MRGRAALPCLLALGAAACDLFTLGEDPVRVWLVVKNAPAGTNQIEVNVDGGAQHFLSSIPGISQPTDLRLGLKGVSAGRRTIVVGALQNGQTLQTSGVVEVMVPDRGSVEKEVALPGGGSGTCDGAASCAGCCNGTTCVTPTTDAMCGAGGSTCQPCAADEHCTGGSCLKTGSGGTCVGQTCTGCCDGTGGCATGDANAACGTGNVVCQDCAASGNVCRSGQCVAPASCAATCAGCCTAETCDPAGNRDDFCGKNGATCRHCSTSQTCADNGECVAISTGCNAGNCSSGCCSGTSCEAGTTEEACGSGGAQCDVCGPSMVCSAGTCMPSGCGPSCTSGCCGGTTCKPGDSDGACGLEGHACRACPLGESCVSGACQATAAGCDPACGYGCCAVSSCANGNEPENCGKGGAACAGCTADGTSNRVGVCVDNACGIGCAPGWADCDGSNANGCEAQLDSASNCGACSAPCPSRNAPGSPTCVNSVCAYSFSSCLGDFANCDGASFNGCEHTGATCPSCAPGKFECDGAGSEDCEFEGLACPLTLASGQTSVAAGIALDATHVYWLANGSTWRVVKSGAHAAEVLVTGSTQGGGDVAVVGGMVYWRQSGVVWKRPVWGGTPAQIASGLIGVTSVAADADGVYWTDNDSVKVLRAGAAAPVEVAKPVDSPRAVATDGSFIYWASGADPGSEIWKASKWDFARTRIADAQNGPAHIAADASGVYWSNANDGKVLAYVSSTVGVISTQAGAGDLALDATSIYFVAAAGVVRAMKNGSAADLVLAAGGSPQSIALDAGNVYWTDSGKILRLPKP